MNAMEFEDIWHDWLRGVTLIVTVLVLVALYFLHVFTDPVYALVLTVVFLVGGAGVAARTCVGGRAAGWVRIVGSLVVVGAAGLLFLGARQVVFPPEPFATATVSGVQTSADLLVPTTGLAPAWLVVQGRPGASPTGKDTEVKARLRLSGGEGFVRTRKVSLYSNRKATGGKAKGVSLGRKESEMFLLDSLPVGPINAHLTQLEPETALPLTLSLHHPSLPPDLLQLALWTLAAAGFVLSLFVARRGEFPFILPYTLVLAGCWQILRLGISPTHPILPLLGIVIGVGLGGSGIGYLLGKAMQLLARRSKP